MMTNERIKVEPPKVNPGVYALFSEGELVYIGMTTEPKHRVMAHLKNKVFDEYTFIPLPGLTRKQLLHIEAVMIHIHKPKLNSRACLSKKAIIKGDLLKELL